jgi:uncharacterized protein
MSYPPRLRLALLAHGLLLSLCACQPTQSTQSPTTEKANDLKPLKIENHFSGPVRELADAAAKGESAKVRELITQKGVDPNAIGIEKMPVLLWPVYKDNLSGFRALLENGANPNAMINNPLHANQPALALIISLRGLDYAQAALAHGANPNAVSEDEVPMVHVAERGGKWDIVRALIAAGADINASSNGLPGNTLLATAVSFGDFENAYWLLQNGADPSHTISEKMAANPRVIGSQPILENIFYRPMPATAQAAKQKEWQKKCQEFVLARGFVAPKKPERFK